MLFIDVLFKRVVVDIVGFIYFVIDKGNRYILILVDFVIRYLEVILMFFIEIERVVEVFIDIFLRVGVLVEMLSDMGL